jgi:hypothetical protein
MQRRRKRGRPGLLRQYLIRLRLMIRVFLVGCEISRMMRFVGSWRAMKAAKKIFLSNRSPLVSHPQLQAALRALMYLRGCLPLPKMLTPIAILGHPGSAVCPMSRPSQKLLASLMYRCGSRILVPRQPAKHKP